MRRDRDPGDLTGDPERPLRGAGKEGERRALTRGACGSASELGRWQVGQGRSVGAGASARCARAGLERAAKRAGPRHRTGRVAGPRWGAGCGALGCWLRLAGPQRRSGPNQGRRGWAASGKKKQAGLGCFWDWVGLPLGFGLAGLGLVFLVSFPFSTQLKLTQIYLNSTKFEFKLLCTQTK